MPLSEVATALSGLAVVAGGLSSYFAVRTQRDMAKLKNEILEGINGKYLSRKEATLLDRERDKWEAATAEHFGRMEMTIKEHRESSEELREEFIGCRASHQAVKEVIK